MAVVALGDALTAQARNLAVEGIKECLGLVRVTTSTLLHHQGAEPQLFGAHDRMRGMTVLAGRVIVLGNRIVRPVNTLAELFLDPMVTSTARTRDVRRIYCGVRVLRRHFGMRTVAISAGRCYDKTTFQSTTVNTVFISTDDVIDFSVYPRCGLLTDTVATPAQRWDVHRIRWRRWQVLIKCRVLGVTVLARRRIRIPLRMEGSMHAGVVLGDLLGVTNTAVHLRLNCRTRSLLGNCHIRVTLSAGGIFMHRAFVSFLVDVETDGVAVALHGQVSLTVAGQAILVRQAVRVEYVANLVRGVTIDAGRDLARILGPQTTLNDLAVYVCNLPVTRGTGLADVFRMDT